tara:strand:- start:593 stop:835 length:243 start_codon:yes stop_codon:yes gene_type:complete
MIEYKVKVYEDGYKAWYLNGKRHREDGAACEDADGYKRWYLNGEELTEEEFNNRTKTKELTIKELEAELEEDIRLLKVEE